MGEASWALLFFATGVYFVLALLYLLVCHATRNMIKILSQRRHKDE